MDYFYYVIILFILIILFFLIGYKKNKNSISSSDRKLFLKYLRKINLYNGGKEKIIDYDKLLHKILLKYGYNGTLGDILKLKPEVIGNIDEIWELHKLRNKLVHDFDLISKNILNKKALKYEKIIRNILNN